MIIILPTRMTSNAVIIITGILHTIIDISIIIMITTTETVTGIRVT